jgi:hypothetical protein
MVTACRSGRIASSRFAPTTPLCTARRTVVNIDVPGLQVSGQRDVDGGGDRAAASNISFVGMRSPSG